MLLQEVSRLDAELNESERLRALLLGVEVKVKPDEELGGGVSDKEGAMRGSADTLRTLFLVLGSVSRKSNKIPCILHYVDTQNIKLYTTL